MLYLATNRHFIFDVRYFMTPNRATAMPLLNFSAKYSRLVYEVRGRHRNIPVDSIARFARRFVRPCLFQNDRNLLWGLATRATARLRMKRTTLQARIKNWASLVPGKQSRVLRHNLRSHRKKATLIHTFLSEHRSSSALS
jgi:hypothetical protein